MLNLSPLSVKVLKACNGEIVQLPYNAEQNKASDALVQLGLIQRCYDDDQPTEYITEVGKIVLASVTANK